MGQPNHRLNEIKKKIIVSFYCRNEDGQKERGLEETSGRVRDPSRETSQKQEEQKRRGKKKGRCQKNTVSDLLGVINHD